MSKLKTLCFITLLSPFDKASRSFVVESLLREGKGHLLFIVKCRLFRDRWFFSRSCPKILELLELRFLSRNTMNKSRLRRFHEEDHWLQSVGSLPPDLMSASSCHDSASSLSSMGSTEDDCSLSPVSPPRSIFKPYWDKTKSPPTLPILRESVALGQPQASSTLEDTSENELEQASTSEESTCCEPPCQECEACCKRRQIFAVGCNSSERGLRPAPSLGDVKDTKPGLLRHAYSASDLDHRKELTSCLRSTEEGGGRRRSNSVSFSPNVSVLEYNVPKETFAEKGWFKWFA